MAKKRTFTLELELTEPQVRQLCDQLPEALTDTQKLAGLALDALQQMADGGIVLPGSVNRQILDITGPLEDAQGLVRFVEIGCGMNQGRKGYSWYPDPTYVPALEEMAHGQGFPVDQVAQNLVDWFIAQGSAYSMTPDTKVVFFTHRDYALVSDIIGKLAATGTDIAQFLESLAEMPGEPVSAARSADE